MFSPKSYASINIGASSSAENVFKLKIFSLAVLCVSFFFWMWAVLNTITTVDVFDYGVYSFAGSILSSIYIFLKSRGGLNNFYPIGVVWRMVILISHLTVVANYGLGIMFAMNVGQRIYVHFLTYCVIFAILWLSVAIIGWTLITKTMHIEEDRADDFF